MALQLPDRAAAVRDARRDSLTAAPARSMRRLLAPVALNIAVVAVVAEIYAELGLAALVFVLLNVVASRTWRGSSSPRANARASTRTSPGACCRGSSGPSTSATRARRAIARRSPPSRATSPGTSACPSATRSSRTPRGCCTTSASSRSPTASWSAAAQLEDSDWRGVRRHPDIGAELLRDIGVYGPVAEIVRAHHERTDGRGYPRGCGRRDPARSRGSSPWPRSTIRSPRRTPTARR